MKKHFKTMALMLALMVTTVAGNCQRYLKHVVEPNETVYSIPVHYNRTTLDFLALNNFEINVNLKPGDVVLIRELQPGETEAGIKEVAPTQAMSKKDQIMLHEKQKVEAPAAEMKKVEDAVAVLVPAPGTHGDAKYLYDADKDTDMGPNGILYRISKNGVHVVEKKQTMYHIALIYNTTIEDIKRVNNLNKTDLAIGQKLKVSNN